MAIYTPGGLKIRLSLEYAFPLIARLYPRVDAFKVLKTTEGIETLPKMLSFFTGLFCFLSRVDPITTAIATFAAYLFGAIINLTGFYFIPGLVALGTLFTYISGFGILLILLGVTGFLVAGWQSVVAFFAAKLLAWPIVWVLEFLETKRMFRITGFPPPQKSSSSMHTESTRLGLALQPISPLQKKKQRKRIGMTLSPILLLNGRKLSRDLLETSIQSVNVLVHQPIHQLSRRLTWLVAQEHGAWKSTT